MRREPARNYPVVYSSLPSFLPLVSFLSIPSFPTRRTAGSVDRAVPSRAALGIPIPSFFSFVLPSYA